MELIIVTGLSGAGKSVALDSLEDLGYYCIDNIPSSLLKDFIHLIRESRHEIDKAAVCIDARTSRISVGLEEQIKALENIDLRILFLEASNNALIRRYKETRRSHPMSKDSINAGIAEERELLWSIRKIADNVIDTSNLKSKELKKVIMDIVLSEEERTTFIINISSFGYKNGMTQEADMVFDMRFVPNPYYVPELKVLTGNDKAVSDYVLDSDACQDFLKDIIPMIEKLVPLFEKEGKFNLNIAFGCTGGQHRSVAAANEVAKELKEKGYRITLAHRDI